MTVNGFVTKYNKAVEARDSFKLVGQFFEFLEKAAGASTRPELEQIVKETAKALNDYVSMMQNLMDNTRVDWRANQLKIDND